MNKLETKSFKLQDFKADSEKGTFTGYASTFENVDLDNDIIKSGAFKKSLEKSNRIKVLEGHDWDKRVGMATLKEDSNGLYIEKGEMNLEKQAVRDLYSDLKFGSIDQFSIGFQIVDSERKSIKGKNIREIKEIDLWEVSFVTFPANPEARLSTVKSLKTRNDFADLKQFETFLRDSGLSRSDACFIASKGVKAWLNNQGEPDESDEIKDIHKLLTQIKESIK